MTSLHYWLPNMLLSIYIKVLSKPKVNILTFGSVTAGITDRANDNSLNYDHTALLAVIFCTRVFMYDSHVQAELKIIGHCNNI